MNKICNLACAIALIGLSGGVRLKAQDEAVGYFRLANATGLDGKLHFLLNGEDLNPEGYPSGETTGSLGVTPAPVKITATHPLCEDADYSFEIKPGDQTAIIAYVEPQKDQKTGEVKKREIKFGTLERKGDTKKRSATLLFLSVSQQIELRMNNSPVILTPHKQVNVNFSESRGTGVNIAVGESRIGGLDIENPGDYAVIVFDKADGSHGCITFYNSRH